MEERVPSYQQTHTACANTIHITGIGLSALVQVITLHTRNLYTACFVLHFNKKYTDMIISRKIIRQMESI